MDQSSFKKISNDSYDLWLSKSNALEKLKSRQILAYDGHLFKADPETINHVRCLGEKRPHGFSMLDSNKNPTYINDPVQFLDTLIERNQESVNEYLALYKEWQGKSSG